MKKKLPLNTLDELRPPNNNYNFFESWKSNGFKHDTESFEMVNAWWLADAALLAYGDEKFVDEKFAAAGLKEDGFTVQSLSEDNIQCFVAHNENFIIVAFRGTEIDNLWGSVKDWATDFKFAPLPDDAGGLVHHGFNDATSTIWEKLRAYLSLIPSDGKTRTLWVTGHSLGAAIATLAADRISRIMNLKVNGLYTFGSPRVGDADFGNRLANEGMAARTYRFVNNSDVVAKVPPPVLYRHVGSWKLINSDGHIQNVDEGSQLADDAATFDFSGSALKTVESIFHPGGITNNVPDFLADHAPIYYAIHIWNGYKE